MRLPLTFTVIRFRITSSLTPPLSNQEIVARIRGGDTALYEVLMRRYNQRLFRIARSILKDDDEAEDVMQEAYVRAYAFLHQFDGRAQFSTWLAKIAVYEASRRLRKRKRVLEFPASRGKRNDVAETIKSSFPDPEQQLLSQEAMGFLQLAIDALPDPYRCVFVLRQIENMSTSETAACLDLTEETVKVRLLRARQMLRNELYTRAGASSSHAFQFMGARCDRVVQRVLHIVSP